MRRRRVRYGRALVALAACAIVARPSSGTAAETLAAPDPSRIVNGTTTNDYPAVGALLFGPTPSLAYMICSGTLVGCSTFLTAAHCVCGSAGANCQPPNAPDPNRFFVFLPHAGFIRPSRIAVHPDYVFEPTYSHADVAVITLGTPAVGIPPAGIAHTTTPASTSATIVGFGRSGGGSKNADYGIKRSGAVNTTACDASMPEGLVCWDFRGTGANTCNGDSGGPLFVDSGAGEVVAGVTSGGASATCLPEDRSFDTDVGYFSTWVEATAGEPLGQQACDDGSQIGDARNEDDAVSGSLAGCRDTALHEFELAGGSSQLRVSMNAKDDGEADFRLLVRRGLPPTETDYDCNPLGPGQFQSCQFTSPDGGRWYVLVRKKSGTGDYQITVNDRDTLPAVCGNGLKEPGEQCDGADDTACSGLCLSDCSCPQPVCGNGIAETGEDCDGVSDDACPGRCTSECACPCLQGDMRVQRLVAGADRLLVKATIDSSGGAYAGFNPSDGFSLVLSDETGAVSIDLPPGDPGWERSNCTKKRYKWKGSHDGVVAIRIADLTEKAGVIRVKVRGTGLPPSSPALPRIVEARVAGLCTAGVAP